MEVELTAREAGAMTVRGLATADGDLQAEQAKSVVVRRAALEVDVRGPEMEFAGSPVLYEIHVSNRGDATAEQVSVRALLPDGATDVAGVANAQLVGGQVEWPVGDIPAGTERSFSLQCTLSTPGQKTMQVRVNDADDLTASDTLVTTVEALADLKLTVNDPKGARPVGEDAIYEVTIVNRGTKAAQNINVVAQFSAGVEPVSATGQKAELVPGQVLFEPISSIGAGQSVTLKITARAEQAGSHRFRAEVTCGDSDTRLVAEETTRFFGSAANSASRGEPTPARR
jgi:uncharacterized repeat protein (TIGR01451 family)